MILGVLGLLAACAGGPADTAGSGDTAPGTSALADAPISDVGGGFSGGVWVRTAR